MRDDETRHLLLHALADGELDASAALALERTIAAEPALAAAYARIRATKEVVKRLSHPPVSDDFHARMAILAAPAVAARRPRWQPSGDWRAMAASIVLSAALGSGLTYSLLAPQMSLSVEDSVVSGHRRSLLASSPIDIASSDRHTVRPWLDAKLGVSPPTPDLAAQGFPLVGGRVEVVDDRPVPALVYRHKEHLITVVAIPVAPGRDVAEEPIVSVAAGYTIIRWSRPGFRCWAVSDLDASELTTFVADMRAQ
jgi:anti-sigma factor RsiW